MSLTRRYSKNKVAFLDPVKVRLTINTDSLTPKKVPPKPNTRVKQYFPSSHCQYRSTTHGTLAPPREKPLPHGERALRLKRITPHVIYYWVEKFRELRHSVPREMVVLRFGSHSRLFRRRHRQPRRYEKDGFELVTVEIDRRRVWRGMDEVG